MFLLSSFVLIHKRLVPILTLYFISSRDYILIPLLLSQHIDFALTSPYGGGRPGRAKRKRAKAAAAGGGDDAADEDEE